MSLAGCQINPIDVNFHLQKNVEIFDKNSADKIWSNLPSCQLGLNNTAFSILILNFQLNLECIFTQNYEKWNK